jgi:hypothetical protein
MMYAMERTDTPLLAMMGPKVTIGGGTGNMATWGWATLESLEDAPDTD